MNNSSVNIIVTGRVQGVYFRASAAEVAIKSAITGWVRNRADGSVEIVAEGAKSSVEEFILWCRTGPDTARIDSVKVTVQEHKGNLTGFQVRI